MAKAKDTGARGLRSIVEEIMLEIMFELPDRAAKDKGKFMVTAEVVRKEKNLFDTPPVPMTATKSASERKKESA
jgi:ATP-dependent Clp protease ATP-binding subunit ClpX